MGCMTHLNPCSGRPLNTNTLSNNPRLTLNRISSADDLPIFSDNQLPEGLPSFVEQNSESFQRLARKIKDGYELSAHQIAKRYLGSKYRDDRMVQRL